MDFLDPASPKPKKNITTLPDKTTLDVKCKDIIEHWGVIWDNFERILSTRKDSPLLTVPWKYNDQNFQLSHPSSHVASFNIKLFPDYFNKQLHIVYNNPVLPIKHSQVLVEKYCMNQYLHLIPIKSQYTLIDTKSRSSKLPGYYIFNYGTFKSERVMYDDIVVTVHVPCMVKFSGITYPILSMSFAFVIPSDLDVTTNTFLWDVFLDSLNLIFFEFQVTHFEEKGKNKESYQLLAKKLSDVINKFDEYMLAMTTAIKKKEINEIWTNKKYVQKIIENHLVSTYTLIVSDNLPDAYFAYNICSSLDAPDLFNQPLTSPITPKILNVPNPFFRTMCLTSFSGEYFFSLPFPYCVISTAEQSVSRISAQSTFLYFIKRTNYLLLFASKKLGVTGFVPSIQLKEELVNPNESNLLTPYSHIFEVVDHNILELFLFKICDLLVLKARTIVGMITQKEIVQRKIENSKTKEIKNMIQTDDEGIKIILGLWKFTDPIAVAMVTQNVEEK
ncbi:hypothetical protein EIN_169330 [Entamoeba invadens IP1]|uniref:Uncharacterized protein n=1 Tax=Entamoeba invadens IP1 TaxID=370355 RepID=A0A0A1U0T5_ENTIV|nr:hypothetical protein EIN_169330 [Entamoeba invadens IP1]ELP84498.1 hypothetical protein EIN_169330 [Entamoeba invadens IP1]|eukprot:XP_004183844.1 hypothetical protein EIN_169330 [Entamoeba invadens IP1]